MLFFYSFEQQNNIKDFLLIKYKFNLLTFKPFIDLNYQYYIFGGKIEKILSARYRNHFKRNKF